MLIGMVINVWNLGDFRCFNISFSMRLSGCTEFTNYTTELMGAGSVAGYVLTVATKAMPGDRLTVNWPGMMCTKSLMGRLDSVAWDLLWGCVDGLRVSVDRLRVTIDGLSIDGLTIDWLSVDWSLDMGRREAILPLSLGLSHLTEEANRSFFLGSAIIEAADEAEVHRLE